MAGIAPNVSVGFDSGVSGSRSARRLASHAVLERKRRVPPRCASAGRGVPTGGARLCLAASASQERELMPAVL